MKTISAALSALFLALPAAAVPADDVTPERFPDADAVLVDDVTRVAYRPDGTSDETCESWIKVLTEKGRRETSVQTLSYSKRYGEAEIVSVGILGTNGAERAVDVSATTKESTDNGSMSANIYDPLDRKIVCTVPGLRVGETLHLKTARRTRKPRCKDQWSELAVFEWSDPILRSRLEIRAPKERPLRRTAVRNPLGNVVETREPLPDGGTLHVFTATNSPQAFPEPDMPPLYTQVQHVRVSTAADWPEISRWYWDLCAPHLAKTNAAMAAKVAEIQAATEAGGGIGDAALPPNAASGLPPRAHQLVRALFKFVSQEVRYMGLTMEDTSPGYAPHDVDVTFDNRYGVCRDKAGLLVAMLRLAGFKAFPVLINVGAKLDPDVPQPFFNHAIVAVETSPFPIPHSPFPYLLMDPTNENAKDLLPAYESDKSYLVCRPEGDVLRLSPTPPPKRNAVRVASRGVLAKDGSLALESDIRFDGINDTAYRAAFVSMQPEDRVKFFERAFRRLSPGAEIVRCDVRPRDMRDTESPVRAAVSVRLPEALLRGETRDALAVPFVSKSLGVANFLLAGNTSLATRKYPLVLDSTAALDETVEIDLAGAVGEPLDLPPPEGQAAASEMPPYPCTAEGTPSVASAATKVGAHLRCARPALDYARTFAVSNGTLTAMRRLAVSKVELPPAEYADLREDVKRVESAERRQPVFRVDPLAEADVRRIDSETDVDIASDRAWTVTNRVVKEVLTYKGKKSSAELKLAFNPCVETLELVSATVSNRDGRVVSVSPREMNVMDCGWAARAPRYPASKLLVVNLPSVEIGSVISYVTARAVTNAPAPFYAAYSFDSRDPVDRVAVRVNGWSREVRSPRRVPNEPGQPAAALWRDRVVVSSNRFEKIDLRVGPFVSPLVPTGSVRAVRDWMAKNVKVAGPSLYEVPLALQLTPPETVLRERYATRLDYVRTLAALLRGAGREADVVLAADNANDPPALREADKSERPNVRAFDVALCRVKTADGVVFLGTESQYSPLGPTRYAGSDFFDPSTAAFGLVTVPAENFRDGEGETTVYRVREDGAVDLDLVSTVFGSGVGAFRKRHSEILPEDRSRLYQSLLGNVSQAATATGELVTDIEGYPATLSFSCYVPDFATADGDALTLRLPNLLSTLPTFTGRDRQTPFAVAAADREFEDVTVRFPEGYTVAEHLPDSFAFANPSDPKETWLSCRVTSRVVDGALEVKVRRDVAPRISTWHAADAIELVRERSRRAASRANGTIVVRKDVPSGK